jgi:hypothetical protein
MKKIYNLNKSSGIGEVCICPSCDTEFIKKTGIQVFCKTRGGTKCKDKYWNTVTPTKRNNTTRISPANKRFRERFIEREESLLFDDDQGWDAHKETF